jgi:hypothetical protein
VWRQREAMGRRGWVRCEEVALVSRERGQMSLAVSEEYRTMSRIFLHLSDLRETSLTLQGTPQAAPPRLPGDNIHRSKVLLTFITRLITINSTLNTR